MTLTGLRHESAYLDEEMQRRLLADVLSVVAAAPLYTPTMPRTGRPMSVRMTNCGPLGWVTDKAEGYRYQATHPATGEPWPPMPPALLRIWQEVSGATVEPEACLVNHYVGAAKLGLHQDRDEQEMSVAVVSVSLGDDAWFRVGGLDRRAPSERLLLRSGDVVVLGGVARMAHHGIDRIVPGTSNLLASAGLAEGGRINLTMRRVTPCGAWQEAGNPPQKH